MLLHHPDAWKIEENSLIIDTNKTENILVKASWRILKESFYLMLFKINLFFRNQTKKPNFGQKVPISYMKNLDKMVIVKGELNANFRRHFQAETKFTKQDYSAFNILCSWIFNA